MFLLIVSGNLSVSNNSSSNCLVFIWYLSRLVKAKINEAICNAIIVLILGNRQSNWRTGLAFHGTSVPFIKNSNQSKKCLSQQTFINRWVSLPT